MSRVGEEAAMKRGTALLAAVLVMLTAGVVTDGEARQGWETLEGHKVIMPVVEVDPSAAAFGLNRKHVERVVELRLREAGIRVASLISYFSGYLYVNIAAGGESTTKATSVRVEYGQRVVPVLPLTPHKRFTLRAIARLDNEENAMRTGLALVYLATTWSCEVLGLVSAPLFTKHIEVGLDRCMDEFINDWFAANPRE